MKLFTQIPPSFTRAAGGKYMDFPPEELPDLKERLTSGKTIGTTRVDAEKGKYAEGEIVDSELGPLKVVSIAEGRGIENHPHYSELTSEWKLQIGDQSWDYITLKCADDLCSSL
jgi:hypothetical protein